MHYQRYFDNIIENHFEPGDPLDAHTVKGHFIDIYGSRNTPHINKISLMLRVSPKVELVNRMRKSIEYRRK
jgi:hypothetical protein